MSPFAPLAPVLWLPVHAFRVDADLSFCHGFEMRLDSFAGDGDDVLAFEVVNEVEML